MNIRTSVVVLCARNRIMTIKSIHEFIPNRHRHFFYYNGREILHNKHPAVHLFRGYEKHSLQMCFYEVESEDAMPLKAVDIVLEKSYCLLKMRLHTLHHCIDISTGQPDDYQEK
ncbi:hypothetical protein Bhyg_03881 [Pseudolycoriella hygida]|uniref:Uncharacterized protein n=1 Tax=Pseudolycoriella hygida TaxID=35572 RepID=A0A9Q0S9P7_9DIPT|nr:hypothetical protein Bhyg_03881 [Pseudolycoriella hygida]